MILLKLSLLLLSSVCIHISLTPPNSGLSDRKSESERYHEVGKVGWTMRERSVLSLPNVVVILRRMMHFLTALEALSILSWPHFRIPPHFSESIGIGPDIITSSLHAAFKLSFHRDHKLSITPAFLLGTLLVTLGALIRLAAYRALGRDFTFLLTLRDDHKLCTHGVYSIVRHPSYTACFLVFGGACLSQLGPGSLWAQAGIQGKGEGEGEGGIVRTFGGVYVAIVMYMTVSFVQRTRTEDEVLRRRYGEQWERWAERTRYRLVPYVF